MHNKFIKLTDANLGTEDCVKSLFISVDSIQRFYDNSTDDGKIATYVHLKVDGSFHVVKETPEEIVEILELVK